MILIFWGKKKKKIATKDKIQGTPDRIRRLALSPGVRTLYAGLSSPGERNISCEKADDRDPGRRKLKGFGM